MIRHPVHIAFLPVDARVADVPLDPGDVISTVQDHLGTVVITSSAEGAQALVRAFPGTPGRSAVPLGYQTGSMTRWDEDEVEPGTMACYLLQLNISVRCTVPRSLVQMPDYVQGGR